jgi:hypothetical protein
LPKTVDEPKAKAAITAKRAALCSQSIELKFKPFLPKAKK